jgi:hypothetical protein
VSELTPNLVRRSQLGLPTEVRVPSRVISSAEAAVVSDTLDRLERLAIGQRDGDTARRVAALARRVPWDAAQRGRHRITSVPWGVRSDARYRRIFAVWQLLNRPELEPTVGPGELRLGVKALPRLFEYWTFLQVIRCAEAAYGPPLTDLTSVLSQSVGPHGRLLELVAGTEVEFPGGIVAAFEPAISVTGRSWRNIEFVPHPKRDRNRSLATPDVVVLRTGPDPEAVIIDAKYVARNNVHSDATEIHDKYARMRIAGRPIVTNVIAVHPHADLRAQWSGYAFVGAAPGGEPLSIALPRIPEDRGLTQSTEGAADSTSTSGPSLGVAAIISEVGLAPELAVSVLDVIGGIPSGRWGWGTITLALLREIFDGSLTSLLDDRGVVTVAEIGQLLRFVERVMPALGPGPTPVGRFLETLLTTEGASLRLRLREIGFPGAALCIERL